MQSERNNLVRDAVELSLAGSLPRQARALILREFPDISSLFRAGTERLRALGLPEETASASGESGLEFTGIDTLRLTIGRLKFSSDKNSTLNKETYVGYKNETVKNVKSLKDLEPLIARISLEKDVDFLSDNLLSQGTNAVQNATKSAEKEAHKALEDVTDPLKKK